MPFLPVYAYSSYWEAGRFFSPSTCWEDGGNQGNGGFMWRKSRPASGHRETFSLSVVSAGSPGGEPEY